MKEKVDLTRSVPFLKPGNPYQLLDAVRLIHRGVLISPNYRFASSGA